MNLECLRYELKNLLALYNGLVEFIEGSPVYQSDLERVCATKATAIFVLANKATNVCNNMIIPSTLNPYVLDNCFSRSNHGL